MSYRCGNCSRKSPDGIPAYRVVTKIRERPRFEQAPRIEIAQELTVCALCAPQFELDSSAEHRNAVRAVNGFAIETFERVEAII